MKFRSFLLNENRVYLGQKIGDILTATQELKSDTKNMGTRDLVRFSERIVNQIRRILHSNWPKEEIENLKTLQKVAVAIMKAIEEKENLPEIISGASATLEKLTSKLGVPINKLGTADKSADKSPEQTSPPLKQQSLGPIQSKPTIPPMNVASPPLAGDGNLSF